MQWQIGGEAIEARAQEHHATLTQGFLQQQRRLIREAQADLRLRGLHAGDVEDFDALPARQGAGGCIGFIDGSHGRETDVLPGGVVGAQNRRIEHRDAALLGGGGAGTEQRAPTRLDPIRHARFHRGRQTGNVGKNDEGIGRQIMSAQLLGRDLIQHHGRIGGDPNADRKYSPVAASEPWCTNRPCTRSLRWITKS